MLTPRHRLVPRSWLRLPRRTVRLRLTMVYTALFLVSGASLLAITYLLVRQTGGVVSFSFRSSNGVNSAGVIVTGAAAPVKGKAEERPVALVRSRTDTKPARFAIQRPDGLTPAQAQIQAEQLRALAKRQHDSELHQLLRNSGTALGLMAAISILLGWLAAGRVLRPLRTLNERAREISASSLHKRLALAGPDDELKQLANTIDDLLARLESSFQAQRQFVANASHELRSPLARARTIAEVAIDDPEATVDSLRASHRRVLAAGEQQEQLIEALLTLARSERGLDEHERVDLAGIVRTVLASRRDEAEQRSLYVHATLRPAETSGDARLVERLVANLVDNALRYNEPHGRIDVLTTTRAGRAVLSVANGGPLVPPGEVERLFEPFRRLAADRTDHGDGVGLGLSIVQAIAVAHEATLAARAQPGGGLDVEVAFPPPQAAASPGRTSLAGRRSRAVSTGGLSGSASGAAPNDAAMRSGSGVP